MAHACRTHAVGCAGRSDLVLCSSAHLPLHFERAAAPQPVGQHPHQRGLAASRRTKEQRRAPLQSCGVRHVQDKGPAVTCQHKASAYKQETKQQCEHGNRAAHACAAHRLDDATERPTGAAQDADLPESLPAPAHQPLHARVGVGGVGNGPDVLHDGAALAWLLGEAHTRIPHWMHQGPSDRAAGSG
jgi:hypothetical protein